MSNANLLERLVVFRGNFQHLDTDLVAAKNPFPYVGKATTGDRVVTEFCEIIGYDVRGW